VYPKVSVPTTDDAIIFSTTENTTQDTAGSDKPLTERLRITGNGNVGVGTDDPQYKLDVNAGTDIMLRLMSSASTSGKLIFGRTGNTEIRSHAIESYNSSGSQNNYMKFLVHDGTGIAPFETRTEVMTLRGDGNVGIGADSPSATLEVVGPSSDSDSVGTTRVISRFTTGDGVLNFFSLQAGYGAERIGLQTTIDGRTFEQDVSGGFTYGGDERHTILLQPYKGRVGIGRTDPGYTLDVNGTIRATNVSPSDDRIKYNEQGVSNALTLISQLNPQKYEKIMELPNPTEGTWIPTDEEWENVKEDYTYGDEFGFIAQDVRNIPELAFLVHGEETRTDTKTSTPEEYSNLTTEEQATYTPSYVYDSNVITQSEYSNLTPEEQGLYFTQYTKQIETQTPLALNYQGLFVVAIGAIKELKAKNDALEARILALESA
jgi:hypothetical protein